MKSKRLLSLMLLCFAFFGVARAQVTIGDLETAGNDTYLPMNSLYNYSYSQQLYTADEIGTAGTINAITIWMYGNADLYEIPFDIYMVETDKESFTSTTDWVSVTSGDIVYSGSVTVHNTTAEAYTFELATPFAYSGTGNLMIAFDNNCGQWKGGLNGKVFTATDGVLRSLYYRDDNTNVDPTNISSIIASSAARAMRNVIEIDITPGGGPSCARPTGLAINYTGGTTAEVSWNSDATAWNIDVNGTVTAITTNPYTLTDLELGTAYTVKVQANCGGGDLSDWSSAKSFTTDLCMPEDMCELRYDLVDSYGDGWNGNAIKVVDAATGAEIANLTIASGSSASGRFAVCDGRAINFVWVAGSYPSETSYTFYDINNDELFSGSAGSGLITDYTVNCTPAACPKPQGLTVSYTGGTEATISWTSDATAWNMRVNGTEINGTITNPYTLTGLELATTYEVEVQANCGDATSEWAGPVSFTTDACMPEDLISVNYELTDSYGDGWNGNYILVVDESCNIVEMLTIESGNSASGTLRVCGSYMQFLWYAGNYPGETSWVFTDNAGNVLFEGAGSADMATLDVLYTIDNNPYSAPADVAASEVGPRSAKLSWTETGTATAWQILLTAGDDEEGTIIDANSNPFVITGLTPETEYFAQVRATGANGTSIWTCLGADFTTEVACPNPTNLSVTAYPTSADVAWDGLADAYDLEWALMPASESKDALWLQYDNGTMYTGVGNGTTQYEWTWGVMYPASMLDGNGLLSKVSIYETAQYNTQDITINVYTGGDEAPETLVYTETVTPAGVDGFHEITFAEPVTIDPTQNLWITLTETGYYVIAACQGTESNNDWVDNGGWAHIGDLASSLAGCNWMIRGYVEPAYDPSTLEWNPVSGVTSPYTIEGLQPETTYIVRVKALCGGEDGESGWAMITFKTPSACDMPNTFNAEAKATSATLSWVGYQESYILRYRHTEETDPTAPATIILEAHNVWGEDDLSGYQMLIDADATAYGTIIPESGGLTTSGDASEETYAEFEYKIPVNADGAMTTENIVFDDRVTIQIPAGTYDWCITNPTPEDRIWIASGNGNVNGRQDDFVFEPGVTYEFVVSMHGTNDGVDLTTTRPMTDWTEVTVNEVPYTLTGLTPETYYEWQIQGVNASCETLDWTEIQSFTTLEAVTQTITLTAGTNWVSTYVEITKEDLQNALVAALSNPAGTVIKSQNGNSTYRGGRWRDQSFTWDVAKMYKIVVPEDCEITLTGMPINPAEHPITIAPNAPTWIGFPFAESMTPAQAIPAGFAVNADIIKGKDGNARYGNGNWRAQGLNSLEPGKGYMYVSGASVTEERTLVYPSASKAAKASPKNDQVAKVAKNKSPKTLDISFIAPKATMPDIKVENKSNTALKNAFNKLFNK